MSTAMMAMTTSSSMSVKPRRREDRFMMKAPVGDETQDVPRSRRAPTEAASPCGAGSLPWARWAKVRWNAQLERREAGGRAGSYDRGGARGREAVARGQGLTIAELGKVFSLTTGIAATGHGV